LAGDKKGGGGGVFGASVPRNILKMSRGLTGAFTIAEAYGFLGLITFLPPK